MNHKPREVNFLGRNIIGRVKRLFNNPEGFRAGKYKEQFLVVGVVIAAVVITLTASSRWVVTVDGRPVGVVGRRAIAEKVVAQVLRDQELALGQPVRPEERVDYRRVRVARSKVLTPEELREILDRELHLYTRATAVLVGGQERFFFKDDPTAKTFLDTVKRMYTVKQDQQAVFGEKIELAARSVPVYRVASIEDAVAAVRKGIEERWRYTVKDGDTLWEIAAAQKLGVEDIIAANPGLNPDRLSIGQTIRLRKETPVITVVQTFDSTKIEAIPFSREIRYDRSLHRGEVKVVKEGRPGKKEITYRVTVQNGVEVRREVKSTRELSAPEKQIERRGSVYLLASRGNGRSSLGWPVSGSILSGYGMRWGRMHTGLDIDAGYGVPVGAAGSGTVIQAGWYGGYGRVVDVDHGDGVVTRYAHLSEIDVGVGEAVGRGQVVGKVGSSGHSYGPHLHFEVIINGAPRNPLNHL